MSDSHEKVLVATASLGVEAEVFLASDLGRYLLGRAEKELEDARTRLETASPLDTETLRVLQDQAWRARSFRQWLGELVSDGKAAHGQLEQEEAEGLEFPADDRWSDGGTW